MKKKKSARKQISKQDKEKEQQIQLLISLIEDAGIEVRRERLKRGISWSVQGGTADVYGKPVLFLDRNLSREDQIDFLLGQITDRLKSEGLSPEKLSAEKIDSLPQSIQILLGAC